MSVFPATGSNPLAVGANPLGFGGSPFGASPFGGSPFGGMTGYGFEVPQGDPSAIEGAARSATRMATLFAEEARAVTISAQIAGDGWRGHASGAFTSYSGSLKGALAANAGACDDAASALQSLARTLAHAQQVCQQALGDCIKYHGELTTQQTNAQTAGRTLSDAQQRLAAAVHPAQIHAYANEVTIAEQQQTAAQNAARAAQTQLEAAQKRGQRAWEAYEHEARGLANRIGAAASDLRPAPIAAGGPPPAIALSPRDISIAAAVAARGANGQPLINAVPVSERTPAVALALIRAEQQAVTKALDSGGAHGPYTLWSSKDFWYHTSAVNADVVAGTFPPRPANWDQVNLQQWWQGVSKYYSSVSCTAGACSAVKVTGTGTNNFTGIVNGLARTAEWTAVGACTVGSDGACAVAVRVALIADTAANANNASSPGNFLARETVSVAETYVAGGAGYIRTQLGAKKLITEAVLPQTTAGKVALNAFFTGPSAGMTMLSPTINHRLFPDAPPPPKPHHHGHGG